MIRSGNLDIGFYPVIGAGKQVGLQSMCLVEDSLALITPASHRLTSYAKIALGRLVEESFVDLTRERRLRTLVDRIFAAHHLTRTTVFEINDEPTAVQFVEAGLGVAILPAALARFYAESRKICVIPITKSGSGSQKWRVLVVRRLQKSTMGAGSLVDLFMGMLQDCPISTGSGAL